MLMQMQEVFFSIENKHKKSHNHKELKRGGKCVLEWNEAQNKYAVVTERQKSTEICSNIKLKIK